MRAAIKTAIDSLKENTRDAEIAFFGGSFTAIDRGYMLSLLDAAAPYMDRFKGIRFSTRPDAITDEIMDVLSAYKVSAIELGAQSMSDEVLSMNDRGHTADDVRAACAIIRSRGIELGLQMMTGLYGSSSELDRMTAREFIALSPDTVRIYPTVVMRSTKLCKLYESGEYTPQTVDEAVALCAELIPLFENAGIRVIRVGLHDTDDLRRDMVAGAFHPALRELCESRLMLDELLRSLSNRSAGRYAVAVNPRSVSRLIGNRRGNINILRNKGYEIQIIQDDAIPDKQVILRGKI